MENGLVICEGIHKERGNKGKVVQLVYHDDETGRIRLFGYEIQITSKSNQIVGGGFFPTSERAINEFQKTFEIIKKERK